MNVVTADVREQLRMIYSEADAAVAAAGPRCDSSGRCCRFREYGHTLFISQIEANYLLEAEPPVAGPFTDAGCPFQVENLCTARERRPLGCRLYFCDPSYQENGARLSERYVREMKQLCDRQSLPWRYAPLHAFLKDYAASNPDSGTSNSALRTPNSESRLPLPLTTREP